MYWRLVEAGFVQDTGSCIPPTLVIPWHKWEDSLFTSGLLLNITPLKVEEVCLTAFLISCKILFFLFRNCNLKIIVGISVAVNKLTVSASVSIQYLQLN